MPKVKKYKRDYFWINHVTLWFLPLSKPSNFQKNSQIFLEKLSNLGNFFFLENTSKNYQFKNSTFSENVQRHIFGDKFSLKTPKKCMFQTKMTTRNRKSTNFHWNPPKNACVWTAEVHFFAEISQKMHVSNTGRIVRTLGRTIFRWNLPKNALHWNTVWIVWNWWEYNISPKSPKYCYDCLLFVF